MASYVVMPEHVHLLISEPGHRRLASAVQAIKQSVSRRLVGNREHFWQERYYDFDVWSSTKRIEKVKYIHRNPVGRGLVERAEDWIWSSFRNYLTGEIGTVEVESLWTEFWREKLARVTIPTRQKHSDAMRGVGSRGKRLERCKPQAALSTLTDIESALTLPAGVSPPRCRVAG